MTQTHLISPSSSTNSTVPKHYVNWHEAAVCAVQIELRDYADLLDFQPEFILGKNSYRIDLLVIKKLSQQAIPKNIARIFTSYNLFEIKGIHSSITIGSYYKTIGTQDSSSTRPAEQHNTPHWISASLSSLFAILVS